MKKSETALILKNERIADGIFDMTLKTSAAKEARAGQFIEIYPDNGENILPRPISICEILEEQEAVRIVYQVVGSGTKLFSEKKQGDFLRITAPLGNGYSLEKSLKDESINVFVGGGIGVPPLLETVKRTKGTKIVVMGFRSKTNLILKEDFERAGAEVYVATDDGSKAFHGNVVELMREFNITGDIIYSCGPKIMLKFLSQYAEEKNILCQVSMEERMACGIGACVGCVVKIKDGNDIVYKKVCKDGPVFDSKEVVWNE